MPNHWSRLRGTFIFFNFQQGGGSTLNFFPKIFKQFFLQKCDFKHVFTSSKKFNLFLKETIFPKKCSKISFSNNSELTPRSRLQPTDSNSDSDSGVGVETTLLANELNYLKNAQRQEFPWLVWNFRIQFEKWNLKQNSQKYSGTSGTRTGIPHKHAILF